MSFYLDTSVLIPLQIDEPKSMVLHNWMANAEGPLVISDLAAAEFASAMSRYIRMGQLSAAAVAQVLDNFDRWRDQAAETVENLPIDIRAAGRLVRQPSPRLLTPDAIHLATCQRLGYTLVAHDDDLLLAAAMIGLPSVSPE